MRGPAQRLAEVTRELRQAVDNGRLPPHMVKRQLRTLGLELLKRYPADGELWRGFENLRELGFQPPAEIDIPTGNEAEILEKVWAMTETETRACASALLELPDPTKELGRARAVMEILLMAEGELERVRLLHRALKPFESAERLARWNVAAHLRFGRGVLETYEDDDLNAFLEREGSALRGTEAARMWRMVAISRLSGRDEHGIEWLVPCCGGTMLLNWEAALRRRPALAEEASEIRTRLEQAFNLADFEAPGMTPMEHLLHSAEEADRRGDYAAGTEFVLDLLARFPASVELTTLALQRVELLMDAHLMARLESEFGLVSDVDLARDDELTWTPPIAEKDIDAWCERLNRLGVQGVCESDDDRYFLEAAGATERALRSWIELGSTDALFEAIRIASTERSRARTHVREVVEANLQPDEKILAEEETSRDLVRGLLHLHEPGAERRDWFVRLVAAGWSEPQPSVGTTAKEFDDPHSPDNRIAAGEDLLAEDHVDGAAAIASSLIGKVEDVHLRDRFLAFVRSIFRASDVPLTLKESVGRHIRGRGFFAQGLLQIFAEDARAAHPMLDVLHAIGKDADVSDALRYQCLRGWLNVWRVTDTVPSDGLIRPFMRQDGGLLVLAAASISGVPDPVAMASGFLTNFPPLEHPPSTWARQILNLRSDGS